MIASRIDVFVEVHPTPSAKASGSSGYLELAYLPAECCTPQKAVPSVIRQALGKNIYHGTIDLETGSGDENPLHAYETGYSAKLGSQESLNLGNLYFPQSVFAEDSRNEIEAYMRSVRDDTKPWPTVVRNVYFLVSFRLHGCESDRQVTINARTSQVKFREATFL